MRCVYCGENEGTCIIMNPNFDDTNNWNVCNDCKDTIEQQQMFSFGAMLAGHEDEFSKNYGEKLMVNANKELDKIAKHTKQPIMNACIYKNEKGKYESAEIVFTGEK